MAAIDDPIDAVKNQYPKYSSDPVDVLLDVVAESHPFAGMANAIRNFFSKREAGERVEALLGPSNGTYASMRRGLTLLSRSITS